MASCDNRNGHLAGSDRTATSGILCEFLAKLDFVPCGLGRVRPSMYSGTEMGSIFGAQHSTGPTLAAVESAPTRPFVQSQWEKSHN